MKGGLDKETRRSSGSISISNSRRSFGENDQGISDGGFIRRLSSGQEHPCKNHLQYADGTLIFCGENEDQIRNVKATLISFEAVSGLKVNFFKTELMGIRTERSKLLNYVEILGSKVGDLPASYLGMPLCLESVFKCMWNSVVERVERKLTAWKANYPSIGGRVTLLRSVLSNLQVYYFSLFKCLALII